MGRKAQLLTNEVAVLAKEGISRIGKNGAISIKFRMILAAYDHGITKICGMFDVSKPALIGWIKILKLTRKC